MVVATVERTIRPTDEAVSDVPCVDDDAFRVLPLGCVIVARTLYKYICTEVRCRGLIREHRR